ncbi:MAG: protease modulator HflK [Phycisphaerae bacterium]|nr:protease modulator HflK [Phycisphaerae bacterium]
MSHNHKHNDSCGHHNIEPDAEIQASELDAGGKSLADALRISFAVLKIVMVVLIVLFFSSGVFTVGPDERAMVLRFGKIRGDTTAKRILNSGLHWAIPYPIEDVIKFPGKNTIERVSVDTFWYDETNKYARGGLNPVTDGYCITRNDTVADLKAGDDYNIVHSKWLLTYRIADCELFFKNIKVKPAPAGQNYIDVLAESVDPLLKAMACDSIVAAMVNFSIDEAIKSDAQISAEVQRLLQKKLDSIESGIDIDSMQITQITWPRQVDDAFVGSIKASNEADKTIRQAKGYAQSKINEAGGIDIINVFSDPNTTEKQLEDYLANASGQVRQTIAEARAYRTKVVESAKANADYLAKLLPEYRKRPKLVLARIYQDAIEEVLSNTQETIIAQPSSGIKNTEFRLMVNRDPKIEKEKGKTQN